MNSIQTNVTFNLIREMFVGPEQDLLSSDNFTLTTGTYTAGVEYLRITNGILKADVLPFQGQQIG